ncbi:MAG: GNAT family N-acetyltransferase [Planctomycetes bacterium]|nr:GNAT family N-acetyltransferase [Planctomycetota bacterium]
MTSKAQCHQEQRAVVRAARPADVEAILGLIRELAQYERLEHQMHASAADLHAHLFGTPPACEALVAEAAGRVVGYAVFLGAYSTFLTRPTLYLEDLYVTPQMRGTGLGKALLAQVAAVAVQRRCPRLDWTVLEWNRPAIEFYRRLGAELADPWRLCRLDGDALARLAAGAGTI